MSKDPYCHGTLSYLAAQLHYSSRPESPPRRRPPLLRRYFRLSSVQDLQELRDPVSHARMHICLRALDMVVQVVSEELDTIDSGECLGGIDEMTRKED